MKCPIVFYHKSHPYYLYAALKQAYLTNPGHPIILLTDKVTSRYSWVQCFNISDYFEEASKFEKIYEHHSPNPVWFELLCFQRWFVINELITELYGEDTPVFCCDPDTMLYDSIDNDIEEWNKYDFTICRTGTPCFSYFSHGISGFCEFVYKKYSTLEGKALIESYVKYLEKKQARYGVHDMTAFSQYEKEGIGPVLHVDIPVNGMSFHHNFQDPNDGYESKGRYTVLRWKEHKPYGLLLHENIYNVSIEEPLLIRFKGIHYQGGSKLFMLEGLKNPYKIYAYLLYFLEKVDRKLMKFFSK